MRADNKREQKLDFGNIFGAEADTEVMWPVLPQRAIYRIVIDFGHSCYRVEDDRFRITYAGDLPAGGSDSIIYALADRIPGEDRGRFLTAFSENKLRNACIKDRHEIKLICNKHGNEEKRVHVRARISGTPLDLCVEMCFQP